MKKDLFFRKEVVIVMTVLFVAAIIMPTALAEPRIYSSIEILGDTITVDDEGDGDYTSIGDAVEHASSGDIIEVYSGTYQEQEIIISKQITLEGIPYELGEGSDTGKPVVENSRTIFHVEEDYVSITGFHITNSAISGITVGHMPSDLKYSDVVISDNIISNCRFGIDVWGGENVLISHNEIRNNDDYGVIIWGVHENIAQVNGNNFINNRRHASFNGALRYILVASLIQPVFNDNYWDNYISGFPKAIAGNLYRFPWIHWFYFDWTPAEEPYEIGE